MTQQTDSFGSGDAMNANDERQNERGAPAEPVDSLARRIRRRGIRLLLFAAAAVLVSSAVVFVDESEYVIVARFGNIVAVYDRPADRGAHLKLPWPIDVALRFDRRVQLFDPPGREIFTRDRKNITIDAYVCYRVAPPQAEEGTDLEDRPVVRFFRGLPGGMEAADSRLDSRLRSILGTQIGQVELSSLLNVDDSEAGPDPRQSGLLEKLSDMVREQVVRRPGETESLRDKLGIEIVDVRIKRVNLPLGNQQAVFERMKSERKKIADRYRSAGMAENKVIKSQADRQSAALLAKARADAERIRGEAEAEAISILNSAHAQDPEFYQVLRTLDTYRKILNERTTLVLSASSNLLKLLRDGVPEMDSPPRPGDSSPGQSLPERSGDDVSQRDLSNQNGEIRSSELGLTDKNVVKVNVPAGDSKAGGSP